MPAQVFEECSVSDLPSLRHKPAYEELLRALQSLEVKPSSWDQTPAKSPGTHEVDISRYLTSIISTGFEWFDESEVDASDKKESLWDLASKRITERCGRSAMGEINRTWIVPASENVPELEFEIREPPLTGDNLGLKTWGTAFTMAKELERLGSQYLSNILKDLSTSPITNTHLGQVQQSPIVLELGAGTGLVGIAAAAIWSTSVLLTDLEEIEENLNHNIQNNIATVDARGGQIAGSILNWKRDQDSLSGYPKEFDIIIAADSLYDDDHPQLVSDMIKKYLRNDTRSRVLTAVPLRDEKTRSLAETLRVSLKERNFRLLHEGWEICRDDWESSAEEEEVKCWWGIFGIDDNVPG